MKIIEGGVTAAKGFEAAATAAGIKYQGRTDMAIIYSEKPCKVAGTFTTNVVKAAPVKWDRQIVESKQKSQAVIVNSGIANACTGEEGMKYCEETAKEAGKVLKEQGFHFDLAFTSVLKRAENTLDYILKEMGEENIEIKRSWKLNERHYGALQGLNKDETKEKYGAEQVLLWRRSTNVRPPELEETDPRYPGNDPKYKDLAKDELPKTENLIDTIKRVVEYWNSDIKPELEKGKNVIIAAHGNSLRGLIKYLDNMSDEDVIKLELQTGNPICYELDDNLKPIRHYYLKK